MVLGASAVLVLVASCDFPVPFPPHEPPGGGGNPCPPGICRPTKVVEAVHSPLNLSVSGGRLYFTFGAGPVGTKGLLGACPLPEGCGGRAPEVLMRAYGLAQIVARGDRLYWTGRAPDEPDHVQLLYTCEAHDCEGTVTPLPPASPARVDLLRLSEPWLLWSQNFAGQVMGCPANDCSTQSSRLLVDIGIEPMALVSTRDLVAAPDRVYVQAHEALFSCDTSEVCTIPHGSLETGQSVEIAGDELFWATELEATDAAIWRCNRLQCNTSRERFATLDQGRVELLVAGRTLYWAHEDTGDILACALDGCSAPTLLASGQDRPANLAADERFLYWINHGGGAVGRAAIMKIAR